MLSIYIIMNWLYTGIVKTDPEQIFLREESHTFKYEHFYCLLAGGFACLLVSPSACRSVCGFDGLSVALSVRVSVGPRVCLPVVLSVGWSVTCQLWPVICWSLLDAYRYT